MQHSFWLYILLWPVLEWNSSHRCWFKEVHAPVRDLGLFRQRNRCEESETRKRRSLRHLNTIKPERLPPTSPQEKKALRSSQASLNGSLSAICATRPTPLRWTMQFLLSTQIHSERWVKEWASWLVFFPLWSFHFIASDSSPKVLWYLPSEWLFHVLLPCPQRARVKHLQQKLNNSTKVHFKTQIHTSLDGKTVFLVEVVFIWGSYVFVKDSSSLTLVKFVLSAPVRAAASYIHSEFRRCSGPSTDVLHVHNFRQPWVM